MTTLVRNFNTNDNFWETNPAFLTVEVFETFYKNDKTKDKKASSQIMWAIAFLIDPHEHNIWKNLSHVEKEMLIKDDYLKNDKFNWKDYKHLSDEYYKRVLTVPEKDYYELIEKMNERKEFIKNTPYTLDAYEEDLMSGRMKLIKGNAKDLDKMVTDTTKIYDQLQIVRDKLALSKQAEGETKGGMQESATEQGLL